MTYNILSYIVKRNRDSSVASSSSRISEELDAEEGFIDNE
jgi:hypothetical protein